MQGYENLRQMNPENCGDVIEAYLAAADVSKMLSDHMWLHPRVPWRRPYTYEDLQEGATCTAKDEVAKFIDKWIAKYSVQGPPGEVEP